MVTKKGTMHFTFVISVADRARIEEAASKEGLSSSDIVRRAVLFYLRDNSAVPTNLKGTSANENAA